MKRTTQLLARWRRLIDAMMHPAFELDTDEFAEILRTAAEMESSGLTLDPGLRAVLLVLARQCLNSDADPDSDNFDADMDRRDEVPANNETRWVELAEVGTGAL
jgi:hypothetical protein